MGRGSVKRFEKKHGARTFKLVQRSATDDATESLDRVFVEITPGAERKELSSLEDAFIDVIGCEDDFEEEEIKESRTIGEAAKFGILFDDRQYDYTRHLRVVGEHPGAHVLEASEQPKLNEEEYLEELKQLDEAVYKNIKAIVTDSAVMEVLVALEDDAYVDDSISDDFVNQLDHEGSSDSDAVQVLDDLGHDTDGEMEMLGRILSELKDPALPTKGLDRKKGFAEVDEMRRALLADGDLRIPSEPSDFNSDEFFQSSESDEEADGNQEVIPRNCPQLIEIGRKESVPNLSKVSQNDLKVEEEISHRNNLGEKRDKQESQEEKRSRKEAVRTARKERRSEKKNNRLLFGKA